ncbi:hypothetical protein B0H17DRAFT_1177065 [Mycena rosella]|uniref:Uncharacterized protein n=1 Tax=Mycena rosella TaxID=1033263 RepID=A0AAD7DTR4_MYCRO|nr:hypothetical protein B0H17DRAFT_1177065 [Mycena rosella]
MRFTFTSAFQLASLALFCAVRGGNAAPVQENRAIGLSRDEEYNSWGLRDGGVGVGEYNRRHITIAYLRQDLAVVMKPPARGYIPRSCWHSNQSQPPLVQSSLARLQETAKFEFEFLLCSLGHGANATFGFGPVPIFLWQRCEEARLRALLYLVGNGIEILYITRDFVDGDVEPIIRQPQRNTPAYTLRCGGLSGAAWGECVLLPAPVRRAIPLDDMGVGVRELMPPKWPCNTFEVPQGASAR